MQELSFHSYRVAPLIRVVNLPVVHHAGIKTRMNARTMGFFSSPTVYFSTERKPSLQGDDTAATTLVDWVEEAGFKKKVGKVNGANFVLCVGGLREGADLS